ncbi:MAG: beta-ketoacyl synthase chain length factor [Bacteroidetes bacterium]|nr:beta-ketoacyl synthase chain length factor [Bacteroidota bacterium]
MKPLYIISSSCISPQNTFDEKELFDGNEVKTAHENILSCAEPDYKGFINPVQIRRMSRALKLGFSTAIDCLRKSPVKEMDAIIIGTGKGCMIDTEAFLHSIRDYNETALNPTHFIHSTYNQLNGMIALDQKIYSYNVTYAHRGFSFEHTLIDASLLIDEDEAKHVLIGSFDEMTPEHFFIKQRWGYWKNEITDSKALFLSNSPGTLAGEGYGFFVLGAEKTCADQVSILSVQTLYNPGDEEILQAIQSILTAHQLEAASVDLLMLGNNGDNRQQHRDELLTTVLHEATPLYFKHLCGEYDTASQFGFWLLSHVLKRQQIPESLYHPSQRKRFSKEKIRYALLYNNYFESNQSLMLLHY